MAMEDFRVDVVIGKGPGATAIPLDIPPFTLVGATTRAGLLPGPLRDRFGFTGHLEYYEPTDLERIVARSSTLLDIERRPRRPRRGRLAVPGDAPDRQPPAPAGARLRPGSCRRGRHPRPGPGRPRAVRGRRARASTASTAPCSTCSAAASAVARSVSARSPSRWPRSARPSRRSPSRSWSATASSPVRHAAVSPPLVRGTTSGSPRRRERAEWTPRSSRRSQTERLRTVTLHSSVPSDCVDHLRRSFSGAPDLFPSFGVLPCPRTHSCS